MSTDGSMQVSWLRDWWHVLVGVLTALAVVAREVVVRPRQRLDRLEAAAESTDSKLDRLADGVDELRVAQVRMSDAHRESMDRMTEQLTARLDAWARDLIRHHREDGSS